MKNEKQQKNKRIAGIASLFLLLPTPVFAYLDPGSGSVLLYLLIGVFATLIFSIKNLFFRIIVFSFSVFFRGQN